MCILESSRLLDCRGPIGEACTCSGASPSHQRSPGRGPPTGCAFERLEREQRERDHLASEGFVDATTISGPAGNNPPSARARSSIHDVDQSSVRAPSVGLAHRARIAVPMTARSRCRGPLFAIGLRTGTPRRIASTGRRVSSRACVAISAEGQLVPQAVMIVVMVEEMPCER